ncbi:MAG: tetratricopeptide repeat protein [Acidobacteria bacterium]|nr:tetratricopeptide repeat protein [Acidobacteriota bacterium]
MYAAYDPRLKREVAVKVVPSALAEDPKRLERLEREARAAAALNHPNILAVHDIGTHEGIPYIVMERVQGETLAERLRRERPSLDWSLGVGAQIADALAAVHARGILHRDLKPGNVMLTHDGRVKVLDFGLAKPLPDAATTGSAPLTLTGQLFGTPAYMAPEQFDGRALADHRADLYSLGVILFELVTGRRPFQGHDFTAVAVNEVKEPAPSPSEIEPSVPPRVADVISRCLAKDPEARPASAAALKQELEQIRTTLEQRAVAVTVPSRFLRGAVGRLTSSPRARTATAAVALAGGIAVAAIGVSNWRQGAMVAVPGTERPVIAVVPFVNASGQASNDYLGIGIADALTTSLSSLSSVLVVSGQTARDSARATSDLPALARELGASLLVHGSLQRSGDAVRVDARVVTPEGAVLWAGESEASMSDLFALERRIADRLVEGLRVSTSSAERERLAVLPTQNQEAIEVYWQGIALLERTDAEAVERAIGSFERAIALDPRFAVAHAGLGAAFVRQYGITNDGAWMTRANDAVLRALEIDPSQTEVRLALASVYRSTGRNGSAVEELRRVLADDPTNDEARRRMGAIFLSEGRQEEALEQYRVAAAQRPAYWVNHDQLGLFYFRAGRFEDAIRAFTRVTELRPDSAQAFQRLGTAYQALGDKARAREHLERAIAITPDPASYSNLGTLYYSDGQFEEAARAYLAAIQLRPNRAIYRKNLGDTYLKLGRGPEARAEYLETARLAEGGLAVNPSSALTMAQLAVYQAKLGRREEAASGIARALAINPSDPEVRYLRAVVLALVGELGAAVDAAAEAVSAGVPLDRVREDDDLEPLQSIPEFQSLISAPG